MSKMAFQCSYCTKTYNHKGYLKNHIKNKHPDVNQNDNIILDNENENKNDDYNEIINELKQKIIILETRQTKLINELNELRDEFNNFRNNSISKNDIDLVRDELKRVDNKSNNLLYLIGFGFVSISIPIISIFIGNNI